MRWEIIRNRKRFLEIIFAENYSLFSLRYIHQFQFVANFTLCFKRKTENSSGQCSISFNLYFKRLAGNVCDILWTKRIYAITAVGMEQTRALAIETKMTRVTYFRTPSLSVHSDCGCTFRLQSSYSSSALSFLWIIFCRWKDADEYKRLPIRLKWTEIGVRNWNWNWKQLYMIEIGPSKRTVAILTERKTFTKSVRWTLLCSFLFYRPFSIVKI